MEQSSASRLRITAIIACHNRRETTLRCLEKLEITGTTPQTIVDAILVDDGSTDGTAEAVASRFPWVTISPADGTLFWTRGMHRGQALGMQRNVDYLLWLNDDTELDPDALTRLIKAGQKMAAQTGHPCIVVGSTADPETGLLSYGGHRAKHWFRRLSYERVWTTNLPAACDAINGNAVLIPIQVAHRIGNLDSAFEHAMGDFDYALRAKSAHIGIFVAPGFVGHCKQGSNDNTYKDSTLSLRKRWQQLMSKTGLPPRSWLRFTYLHGGIAWPAYFLWPYVQFIFLSVLKREIR